MRNRLLFSLTLMSLLLPVAMIHAQTANPSDALENVGQGTINWTSGVVYATGIGAPPPSAVNPAQARAMAVRAAQVVAYRNLLEIVKGVRVDSETVVENFMTRSDIIKTRVDGIVKGAMIVKTQYLSDGSVEVLVSMPMRGALLDAVVPESFGSAALPPPPLRPAPSVPAPQRPAPVPQAPEKRPEPTRVEPARPAPQQPEKKPEPPKVVQPQQPQPEKKPEPAQQTPVMVPDQSTTQFKGGKATGVVIDGRGLGLKPALLPKIIDPQGQEIYVGQVVARTNAVEQGVAGYAKDVNAAANNFRVTDNPAVIKGVRASGAARTDIMLSQPDSQMLRDLGKKGDFLQYCRVIIVY
ncbi:MAG: LPP20 family lipoprotein [Nitrospirota bacterium]